MARRYRISNRPALVGVDLGRHAAPAGLGPAGAVEHGSTLQKSRDQFFANHLDNLACQGLPAVIHTFAQKSSTPPVDD
jgi:hypothetical protein